MTVAIVVALMVVAGGLGFYVHYTSPKRKGK